MQLNYTTSNIDGIECEYPLFNNDQRANVKKLCKKYNKYISGGSAYFADFKPDEKIGTGINNNLNIPREFINDWFYKQLVYEVINRGNVMRRFL